MPTTRALIVTSSLATSLFVSLIAALLVNKVIDDYCEGAN